MGRVVFLSLLLAFSLPVHAAEQDPYAGITVETLKNGLTVVLAPSPAARTIEMEMRVLTGWSSEDRGNIGAAHLLEHAIFRDERLAVDQSYLQLFKEKAGGNANGVTSWNATSFYASVPSLKGAWALNELSHMLRGRTFTETALEKCRREVLLELGEPENLLQAIFAQFNVLTFDRPDFFETEFRIRGKTTHDEIVRRRTQQLRIAEVQEFYDRHYVPRNMVLFYAGPFKVKETLAFMRDTFEAFPDRPHAGGPNPKPQPRNAPYLRSRVATRDSWISYGVKFWDITPQDEMALRLYFEYLAHRLMKKLRNEAASTYTAEVDVYVDERRYGYATVSFETPRDGFRPNLQYLEALVSDETQHRGLKDADIEAARALLHSDTELIERDSDSMAKLGDRLWQFRRTYGLQKTPWQIFDDLDEDEIRERLRTLFVPERRYLSTIEPPLLFRGEEYLLAGLMVALAIFLGRLFLLKPFEHTDLRYTRKIKYRPLFLVGYTCFAGNTLWLYCQAAGLIDRLLLPLGFVQSTFLLSEYAAGALFLLGLVAITLGLLSILPRKIIVTEQELILKSFTYYSRHFRRTAIRRVAVCRSHHVFTRGFWRWRLRWLHWSPWKKGVLIELDKRRAYFIGFNDADDVFEELQEVLNSRSHVATVVAPESSISKAQ